MSSPTKRAERKERGLSFIPRTSETGTYRQWGIATNLKRGFYFRNGVPDQGK